MDQINRFLVGRTQVLSQLRGETQWQRAGQVALIRFNNVREGIQGNQGQLKIICKIFLFLFLKQ